ncbi:MAG: hypothetical protein ACOX4J_06755 [Anaerovoracaceae bacterium]|jgi:hypothetical protein
MQAIRKRRIGYALLFVICSLATGLFAVKLMVEAAIIFAVISAVLLVFLIRESYLLYHANLIWNNCILAVPSAIISTSFSNEKREVEEIIVSTFGILIGNKIYKWGMNGISGVRLKTIEIDRSWIFLNFGDDDKTVRVELLHGMADTEEAMEIQQKFWRETGIEAVVRDW